MLDKPYTYVMYKFDQDPYELYEVLDENKKSLYSEECISKFGLDDKIFLVAYVDKYNDMDQAMRDWNFEQVGRTVAYSECEISKMKGAGW